MDSHEGNFFNFGDFRFDGEKCILYRGSELVAEATPKALKILSVLIENSGNVVSKEELIKQVWPDSFVEEANLSHHIFRLRKALGETDEKRFIETVPKRGYRFVGEVSSDGSAQPEIQPQKEAPVSPSGANRIYVFSAIAVLVVATTAFLGWRFLQPTAIPEKTSSKFSGPGTMRLSKITNSGKVGAAAISPDGKFITYAQNSDSGYGMLYVRQTDSDREVELLEQGERVFGSKAFSPDGATIYYYVSDKSSPKGALYKIPVLGGRPEKITEDMVSMFTISLDGKKGFFYRRDSQNKKTSIIEVQLEDGKEKIVATFEDEKLKVAGVPVLSPDGKNIIFGIKSKVVGNDLSRKDTKLGIMDIESGAITDLVPETWNQMGLINWMADGSGLVLVAGAPNVENHLYFVSYPDGKVEQISSGPGGYGFWSMGITRDGSTIIADLWDGKSQLWAIDSDGNQSSARQITLGDDDGERGITALPDGSIVYSSLSGEDYDLWHLKLGEGKMVGTPLTSDKYYDAEPAAMPDGKSLVFTSDRAGSRHIFRMDIDGTNIKQLTFGDQNDKWPTVSPDGKWVAYHSMINSEDSFIYRVPSEGGPPEKLTDFDSSFASYSPDGKYLACVATREHHYELANLTLIHPDGGPPLKSWPVVQDGVLNYKNMPWTADSSAIIFAKLENSISNLWKQPINGGEAKKLTDFKSDTTYIFTISRDGKQIITARGSVLVDVVALKTPIVNN